MPIRYAKVASRVPGKTVKAFPEGLVINFLPESEQPLRRLHFRHGSGCHFLLFVYQGRHFCCSSYQASGYHPSGAFHINMGLIGHGRNYVWGNKNMSQVMACSQNSPALVAAESRDIPLPPLAFELSANKKVTKR